MNQNDATSLAEWILNRGVPGILIAAVFALGWVIIYQERRYQKLAASHEAEIIRINVEHAARLADLAKIHVEHLRDSQEGLEEAVDEHMADLKSFTTSSSQGADKVYEALSELSKIAEIFERARRR